MMSCFLLFSVFMRHNIRTKKTKKTESELVSWERGQSPTLSKFTRVLKDNKKNTYTSKLWSIKTYKLKTLAYTMCIVSALPYIRGVNISTSPPTLGIQPITLGH